MDSIKDIERERRQRIVEQNGNSGLHYSSSEDDAEGDLELTIKHVSVAEDRKNTPVYSGFMLYFADAINAVAKCSFAGQQQHAPNEPLKWHRDKSGDELDALSRHLLEAGTVDNDGILHSSKIAWRAMANLQKELELRGEATLSKYNKI